MLKLIIVIAQLILLFFQNKFEKNKNKQKEKEDLLNEAHKALKNKDIELTVSILDRLYNKT